MNIIGINAGPDLVFEQASESSLAYSHDSAAVLVRDGVVVAGMEEERLNRIKHSPKAPIEAIRFCLEQGGIGIEEVDYFAFYLSFHKVKFELELTRAGFSAIFAWPSAMSFRRRKSVLYIIILLMHSAPTPCPGSTKA